MDCLGPDGVDEDACEKTSFWRAIRCWMTDVTGSWDRSETLSRAMKHDVPFGWSIRSRARCDDVLGWAVAGTAPPILGCFNCCCWSSPSGLRFRDVAVVEDEVGGCGRARRPDLRLTPLVKRAARRADSALLSDCGVDETGTREVAECAVGWSLTPLAESFESLVVVCHSSSSFVYKIHLNIFLLIQKRSYDEAFLKTTLIRYFSTLNLFAIKKTVNSIEK